MSRITLFLILTFLVELSFAQHALGSLSRFTLATDANPIVQKSKEEDEVWKDVTVDMRWLQSGLNSQNCSSDQKAYIGCVLAVQAFAEVLNKEYEVVPVAQLNGQKPYYQAQVLALVEAKAPQLSSPVDAFEYFAKMRKELSARFFVASVAFSKSPNSDFELMLNEISKRAGKNVKPSDYVRAASKFFEAAVDPHTSILPTRKLEMASHDSGNSFVGLGIEFTRMGAGLMVRRVMKGSGAAQAGMLAGDLVIAVEGKQLKDMTDEQAVTLMRGLPNSSVSITIQRDEKTLVVSVVRAKVVDPVLSYENIKFNSKLIGYIRLTNFQYEGICDELEKAVATWERQNVDGYVLDLRGNPGGNVKIAACVGGVFLGAKKVVAYFETKTPAGSRYSSLETAAKISTAKPVSVLINAYSASASEIIAGAFRDHNRGYIVGQTTFGKGSYQSCGRLSGTPALTICSTGGLFFAPSGTTNQTTGVVPHIEVFQTKVAKDAETYAMREAQMYLFPLDSKKMPNIPIGNWNQLKAPKLCMDKLNLPTSYDQAAAISIYFKDYQLLNGLAAVNCAGAL